MICVQVGKYLAEKHCQFPLLISPTAVTLPLQFLFNIHETKIEKQCELGLAFIFFHLSYMNCFKKSREYLHIENSLH